MDSPCRARIAGELLGGGKSCDIANLEGDDNGERQTYSGHGHEVLNRRGQLECDLDALLELADMPLACRIRPREYDGA